jgi:SAM-dependent methyltransferase
MKYDVQWCPGCKTLSRQRTFYWFFQTYLPKHRKVRVLNPAPVDMIADMFQSFPNVEYVSIDIKFEGFNIPDTARTGRPIVQADIQELPFTNESFDVILCSHVLEHVPDDKKAMQELYRVLKPSGYALLEVPYRMENGEYVFETYEDPSIVTEEDRLREYESPDHVRFYGKDFLVKLENVGFNVHEIPLQNLLEENKIKLCGMRDKPLNICIKGDENEETRRFCK